MKFRDYLKDRVLYLIFYFINSIFVMVVMMLDLIIRKERVEISNIVYALVLSLVFLILLISIDYTRKRKFYNAINNGLRDNKSLEFIFNIPDNISKEHGVFKELLTKNYMIYENTLYEADTLDNSNVGIPYKPTGRVEGGSVSVEGFLDPVLSSFQIITDRLNDPSAPEGGSITFSDTAETAWTFETAGTSLGGSVVLNDGVKFNASIKLDGSITFPSSS